MKMRLAAAILAMLLLTALMSGALARGRSEQPEGALFVHMAEGRA